VAQQENDFRTVWQQRLRRFRARLDQAGLGGLADGLETGLKPLGPLAAQLLWFSQPGFALFGGYESIGGLADLLEDLPTGPGQDQSTGHEQQ
jgi:hypothetical protein